MGKVRYLPKRETHRRILRPNDLNNLGIYDYVEDVIFSRDNEFTVEMPDDACETLVAKLPTEFALITSPDEPVLEVVPDVGSEPPEEPSDQQDADRSGEDEPEGSSSESDDDPDQAPVKRPRAKRLES
jgi:hypothetical protein